MGALREAHRLPPTANTLMAMARSNFLSAALEGSMVLTAALVAVLRAADAIFHKADLHFDSIGIGLGLLAIALIVNGALGVTLIRIGRKVQSATLEADGQHLLSDAVTSVAAIGGLIAVKLTHWNYADPIAALIVAAYIGFIGVRLMRGAVAGLMDEQDARDAVLLRSILDAHVGPQGKEPKICSYR